MQTFIFVSFSFSSSCSVQFFLLRSVLTGSNLLRHWSSLAVGVELEPNQSQANKTVTWIMKRIHPHLSRGMLNCFLCLCLGAHRNAHGGGGGGDRAQPHFPPPPPIQHHQREVEQHQQQHQQGPPLHAASNASIPTRVSPVPARGSPRMSPRMSPQPPPPSTEPPPLPYKAGGTCKSRKID